MQKSIRRAQGTLEIFWIEEEQIYHMSEFVDWN